MKKSICQFLGLKEDADSVMNFPSLGNNCHHVRPISPVVIDHQKKYCLSENYLRCPVFISEKNKPLPTELVGKIDEFPAQKIYLMVAGIIGAILLLLIVFLLINSNNKPSAPFSNLLTYTAMAEETAITVDTVSPLSSTATDVETTATFTPDTNTVLCVPPENWIIYIVKPTDSLVRLALIFNITVEDLQTANCMMDRTLVKPGEEIYIPGATPTPLASATATVTITRTYRALILPTRTYTERPQEPAPPRPTEPPPPTQPPPTQPPPTQPPPTQPPPTSTEPPPPPPEP